MSGVAAGDIFVRFLPPVLTDSLATLVHSVTSGGYSTSRPHGRQHHRGSRQAPEGRPFE